MPGIPSADRPPPASAPTSRIFGPSCCTLATTSAACGSAQFNPPKASALAPTAACANVTAAARPMSPDAASFASDQKQTVLAPTSSTTVATTWRRRSRVDRHRMSTSRIRARLKRSTIQSERPNSRTSFAAGVSVTSRKEYSARRCAASTSPDILSQTVDLRSSQCVAIHAPPTTSGAHHV